MEKAKKSNSERSVRDKRKRRSGNQHQHHPWDEEEVSLPGAGNDGGAESSNILEVLGKPNAITLVDPLNTQAQQEETQTLKANEAQQLKDTNVEVLKANEVVKETVNDEIQKTINTVASIVDEAAELVCNQIKTGSVASKSEAIDVQQPKELTNLADTLITDAAQKLDNVFEVESHLIETIDDNKQKQQQQLESVAIKELEPTESDLEVLNAEVEHIFKTIENKIDASRESGGATAAAAIIELEPTKNDLEDLNTEVENKSIFKTIEHIIDASSEDATTQNSKSPVVVEAIKVATTAPENKQVTTLDILQAAENLVNHIEKQALEALSQQENKKSEPHEKTENNGNELLAGSLNATPTQAANDKNNEIKIIEPATQTLSQRVDEQLSEVTSILKKTSPNHIGGTGDGNGNATTAADGITPACDQIKLVDVPSPKTPSEAEERKLFIDSLPQISTTNATDNDAQKLAIACKREYYQSLKKYLIQSTTDKPPIPLQTYRWEDLRRARERGGYPWTHLYKRPLGPDEEPEIVLLLRKSQELHFASESPKSLKKVRIDDQVLIKETERYIQELSEEEEDEHGDGHGSEHEHDPDHHEHHQSADESESHSVHSDSISCISDSVLATGKARKPYVRLANIRAIIKRRRSARSNEDAQSLPGTLEHPTKDRKPPKVPKLQVEPAETKAEGGIALQNGQQSPSPHKTHISCYPIMKKLKSMADRQKKRLHIKRVPLKKEERIMLNDETKILKLKKSPKSERGEIPHFIEKQDSDDILEIVELDESPSRKRKDDGYEPAEAETEEEVATSSTAAAAAVKAAASTPAVFTTSIIEPDEVIEINAVSSSTVTTTTNSQNAPTETNESAAEAPPKKTPRLRREHVYEEIAEAEPTEMLEIGPSVAALKESLQRQDATTLNELETINKPLPLDRMGSSEEEATSVAGGSFDKPKTTSTLAPLSSIDSASSDEDRNRPHLSPVSEESDAASAEYQLNESEIPRVVEETEQPELKSSIKKESSPAPSDKKVVTFSHVEDEAEPHREDIELPEHVLEASAAHKKTKNASDHEYEPIGVPQNDSILAKDSLTTQQSLESQLTAQIDSLRNEMEDAENLQRDLEERYFSSEATTPRTESRTDYEIHTSQVDSSALEELPLKPENRKKSFMASAHDRTRRMQAGFKNQAGKIKTKLRSTNNNSSSTTTTTIKKAPSGSPKAKERRRFKAPEFSKIKILDIKRPDMSKLKDFKRPEFTKFNKPNMSKFKLPEKFSTLKLQRSKSLKENEPPAATDDADMTPTTPEGGAATAEPHKKLFEFNFGTYPRAFRKKKKPVEPPVESSFVTGTDQGLSVVASTDTQPSFQSSSSPQGDRGPGPVRSRWADKFSDVSYNDSEGSRYRRYGSEQESFDRESSLERRMKDDLEQTDTGSEAPELGILAPNTADSKQFAEFDEENRAIHEISSLRAGEFKRRPMVHQDSDLRSEDSRDAVGWTDKEMQKIKLLRKAELEAEASYLKYPNEDVMAAQNPDAQSTASSGKKVVMEEIDDDEFFLRKRGVSEDNIELRQYISSAIREGYDINALEQVGQATRQPIEYADYDVPPPKPRRLHKSYRPEDVSQEFSSQKSDYGDDLSMSQNGSDFFSAPRRPMRKGRSRSKYSMESQDVTMPSIETKDEPIRRIETYFDDDEDYLRPPELRGNGYGNETHSVGMNNLDFTEKTALDDEDENLPQVAPRRRKRHLRETSVDKDSLINSLSGRSVSNNYLQPTDDVIVYRTEHEYYKPKLATPDNYTDETSTPITHKSRYDDEEHTADVNDAIEPDSSYRFKYYDEEEQEDLDAEAEDELNATIENRNKFVIDMVENDGYAVVRKEQLPKPTPPARRKKFIRSPGDRFGTLPETAAGKRATPPPERPPPPRGYTPSTHSMELQQKDEDDYEEPGNFENDRPESPRNLQSGEVINKMKYRPLPPPPRPPREKRQRNDSKRSAFDYDDKELESSVDHLDVHEEGHRRVHRQAFSSDESYGINDEESEDAVNFQEVEVSTQTDPLPDDFVCEEFEITDDMRIIEPRIRSSPKTLDDFLKDEQATASPTESLHMTEDEQLARGLQRFRDANQRSLSERSRASSQADRSKSLSRPQTPSAIIIERRVSTPVPSHHENETMLEASLIVRPIDDLDLEEEALRREGLLSDESQQSQSDVVESQVVDPVEEEVFKLTDKENSPETSAIQLDETVENLKLMKETSEGDVTHYEDEVIADSTVATTARNLKDYGYRQQEVEDAERYSKSDYEEDPEVSDYVHKMEQQLSKVDKRLDQAIEDMIDRHIRSEYASDEHEAEEDEAVPPPQPPPRRKSMVGVEQVPPVSIVEEKILSKEVTPVQAIDSPKDQLPSYLGELEVERLRVRALQAGQIMVSQLHGGQISTEELECKSGNLVVKSLELPPGFIEDIVDRVRSTERAQLLTTETQTSLQASRELLDQVDTIAAPPPKPPRQRDLETSERHRNLDEQTQTEADNQPPVFATTQYIESLVRRDLESHGRDDRPDNQTGDSMQKSQHRHHHHHHRHHHYRRCSSSSSDLNDGDHLRDFDADGNFRSPRSVERRHHSRSRSRTHPPSECPSQSLSQAGKQFISACSLSLVNIIDQLTAIVRDNDANKAQDAATAAATAPRLRQVPTLVVFFLVIVFGILIFLLTGRNVHTHHWDFFNPPGNEGRQS